jgi:hypothetical protein
MQREYFCCGCGLFHWVDQYRKDSETGRIDYIPYESCPNNECISHKREDVPTYAVDTYGFAYFSESHKEFIDKMKWSSLKYAPERAVEIYKKQGIRIED